MQFYQEARGAGITNGSSRQAAEDDAGCEAVQRPGQRGVYAFGIKLAVGISLIAFLLRHYDFHGTSRLIGREHPLVFAAVVFLFIAVQTVSALRWQLLARINGIAGSYREYLAYYFIGMFTNVFVPGLVGGDAARALYLGRRHNRIGEAVTSVLADRGAGLLGLFWLAAGASLCLTGVKLPAAAFHATLAAAGVSLAACAAAPLIVKPALRIARLRSLLAPLTPYLCRPVALIPAIALSVALQVSFALCQYLLGLGLNLRIPLAAFLLMVPISNVIASIPISINGLGLREASYVVLLGMAGVSESQAVALSILYFAATLAAGLAGIVPFIMTPLPAAHDE